MAKNTITSSGDFSLRSEKKSRRSYRIKAILLFLFLFAFTLQLTAQYIASSFGYNRSLGTFMVLGKLRVYPFYMGAYWLFMLIKTYVTTHQEAIAQMTASAATIFAFGLIMSVIVTRLYYSRVSKSNVDSLQGSAHWATEEEIIEAGLLDRHGKPNPEGVVVGGYRPGTKDKDIKILRHNGKEHILCFAPTRSGKGVSLVFPTLLNGWNESTFVFDIKGENFAGSAGYRKSIGHKILKLDFTDPYAVEKGTSATFNPLEEIKLDYVLPPDFKLPADEKGNRQLSVPFQLVKSGTFNETSTIQQITAIIIDPQGKGFDDHWAKTASSFMLGAITHLLYKHQFYGLPCPGISDVLSELTQPGQKWQDVVKKWLEFPHKGLTPEGEPIPHKIVTEEAQTLLNKPEKEAGSVLSTVVSNLALFRDPVVSENTKKSSFRIRDLMHHDAPVDLYLIVNPNDQLRLLPITRLFTTQLIFTLVQKMDFKDGRTDENSYKHRLLLLLDEFPSLGRMELFEKALGFIGGYGLKAFIVCQGLSQLYKAYGKDESLRVGCHIQVAFAPNELETSEYLSKLTGQMTIIKENVVETRQEGRLVGGGSRQTSLQEVQRALLTPDECRRLPAMKKDSGGNVTEAGDMLIFPAGFSTVYGRQTLYFKDITMQNRARITPPTHSDNLLTEASALLKTANAASAMNAQKEAQRG